MKAWWQIFPKAFSPADCAAIVDYALKSAPAQQGTIGYGGGKSIIDQGFRRSNVRWLKRDDEALVALFARVSAMAERANNDAFGFDLRGFKEVQFTEYDASNSGHYDWHEDNNWKKGFDDDRKMSMVIQLSPPANYQGGRLELANDPLQPTQFVDQGDVIFFPSFNRHRVTPVTGGKRYSLVTWFTGPHFR